MKKLIIPKLILRSWWRNKLFATISLIGLTIGITCTNLLIAFVIHEYRMESDNPNSERIIRLMQQIPINSNESTQYSYFAYGGDVPEIVSHFPEIESTLRMAISNDAVQVGEVEISEPEGILTDSSLTRFFPLQVLQGDLQEAVTKPGCIALNQKNYKKLFGNVPLTDQTVELLSSGQPKIYRVTAVYKENLQSAFRAGYLASLQNEEEGSCCMILLKKGTDPESFRKKFESMELPTLLGKGHYKTQMLSDSYFDTYNTDTSTLRHQDVTMLHTGLISAILVLCIACFNYINLSFSRLLKQIRMLRTEKLMGADNRFIRFQLFTDAFLTVFIAFLLSLLLANDIMPLFNSIFATQLSAGYFFSSNVFPFILLFILLLSVIPGIYMSLKVEHLTESMYRNFFSGRKKRTIISLLVTVQFFISLVLISVFIVINKQQRFEARQGERYKGIIQLWGPDDSSIANLYDDAKNLPEISILTTSNSGILFGGGRTQLVSQKDDKGNKYLAPVSMLYMDTTAIRLFNLELTEPEQTNVRMKTAFMPTLVNESFARQFVSEGETPVGQTLKHYRIDTQSGGKETIVGIMKDFHLASMNNSIIPIYITFDHNDRQNMRALFIKPNEGQYQSTLEHLEILWKKHFPGITFHPDNLYQQFVENNKKAISFSQLVMAYSLISFLLTISGLFGIAWYAASQRKREIAIRKVNGASTLQIIWLLNRSFLLQIIAAYVIACPIAVYLSNRWMEQFVYRTQLNIGIYVLPLIFLATITLITISLNSWRAATANPVDAIKE